jgi:hypothetical protein
LRRRPRRRFSGGGGGGGSGRGRGGAVSGCGGCGSTRVPMARTKGEGARRPGTEAGIGRAKTLAVAAAEVDAVAEGKGRPRDGGDMGMAAP